MQRDLLVHNRDSKNIVYVSDKIKGDMELLLIADKALLELPRYESPLPNTIDIDPFELESPSSSELESPPPVLLSLFNLTANETWTFKSSIIASIN